MPAERCAAPENTETPVSAEPVTFAALGVPAELVEVLEDEGITTPFPVQAATLPDALAGRDILGRARTGSGKTLGFSLPMVSRLAGGSTLSARPRGLVLVPTRELASQVSTVLKPLARAMNLWVTTIYGGVSYGPQVNALQRRTDIVVATPGRLADLISQGECDLADVEVTVIDEADQMADLGFLPIVRRLLESTPDGGQRMLFSATLDAAIDVLARRFLTDPVLHSVDENSSPAEIEHHVITIEPSHKLAVVSALAGGEKRSLVFTRTKHGAERLARQLTEAGIPAAELHGNLRQNARTRNLAAFADGIARVMVATDIAARGIHIDGIDLVVHADPPAEHKAYVHRSGRTARGGADGVVVTLQMKSQARDVTAMMRKAGITPHAAVAADADSAVLTEIAGPAAPRVTVGRKVAELVRPEDRLAANDRPGVGKPWEGRPRRDRARGQHSDRKPRDDRAPRFQRDDRAPRFDRDDRGSRGSGDRNFGTRDTGERDFGGQGSAGRDARDSRGGNDWYPRSGGGSGQGGGRRPGSFGQGGQGGQSGDRRQSRDSGSYRGEQSSRGGQSYGGRSDRGDRAVGNDRRDDRSVRDDRSFGNDRSRGEQSSRGQSYGDSRSFRDDRPFSGERGARPQGNGRPQTGGRPRSGGADRPQAGGHFGGSSRRFGHSAGQRPGGNRRDSGQGRHF
ncbi:MAG TPA: DEAD/DEAH box helicase [Trebonia sp.]|nr:DEAD/DEAH box helicase [Trebonia sp.]